MTFLLHDIIEEVVPHEGNFPNLERQYSNRRCDIHTIAAKIAVPDTQNLLPRPRLFNLLERSLKQFSATLVVGRSGTGKTAAAAGLAAESGIDAAWYTVEPADISWEVFEHYFSGCLQRKKRNIKRESEIESADNVSRVSRLIDDTMALGAASISTLPDLLVIDDFHHLYEAEWFEVFFAQLLTSIPQELHLLLLCRSKPPGPIWRLRSKQVLNVIDERLLAFTTGECSDLCRRMGLPPDAGRHANAKSFGRISRLLEFLDADPSGD